LILFSSHTSPNYSCTKPITHESRALAPSRCSTVQCARLSKKWSPPCSQTIASGGRPSTQASMDAVGVLMTIAPSAWSKGRVAGALTLHLQPQSRVIIREATGILGPSTPACYNPAQASTRVTTETPFAEETNHKSPSTNYITICPPSLQISCTFI
jgi:hypothetical protein